MAGNRLLSLQAEGVSVWLDVSGRDVLDSGRLQRYVDSDGMRGVTSNPTIFQRAIAESRAYDDQIAALHHQGRPVEDVCWELMASDVRGACDVLMPLYEATRGEHGYVSLEVSPRLSRDGPAASAQARDLWKHVSRPNVMIKIPATAEGLPVIEDLLYEGLNVNVTLIFDARQYSAVAQAYLRALERRHADHLPLDRVSSVASVFVGRVDGEIEKRFDRMVRQDAALQTRVDALRGRVALANAQICYETYVSTFDSERFRTLQSGGARVQKPLWASVSTKVPGWPETLYIDHLIGPDCVHTIPQETLEIFRERGTVNRTLTADSFAAAHQVLREVAAVGIDMSEVTRMTFEEGLQKFTDSYASLQSVVALRRSTQLSRA